MRTAMPKSPCLKPRQASQPAAAATTCQLLSSGLIVLHRIPTYLGMYGSVVLYITATEPGVSCLQ